MMQYFTLKKNISWVLIHCSIELKYFSKIKVRKNMDFLKELGIEKENYGACTQSINCMA